MSAQLINFIRVDKSRRMGWAGHVVLLEGKGGDYKVFVEILRRKTPSGRPRRN